MLAAFAKSKRVSPFENVKQLEIFTWYIILMYCVLYYILGPLRSYKESQNHSSSSEKENNTYTHMHLVNSEKIFLWEGVLKTLQNIEMHCGPDASKMIKAKIPTYVCQR